MTITISPGPWATPYHVALLSQHDPMTSWLFWGSSNQQPRPKEVIGHLAPPSSHCCIACVATRHVGVLHRMCYCRACGCVATRHVSTNTSTNSQTAGPQSTQTSSSTWLSTAPQSYYLTFLLVILILRVLSSPSKLCCTIPFWGHSAAFFLPPPWILSFFECTC